MKKQALLSFISLIFSIISYGQKIDSLKLSDNEIPEGYSASSKLVCKTVHACSFYEQTDLYTSFLGKLVKKDFQAFNKKGDKGSILYFEFESEFTGEAFLKGLLWGAAEKPTKEKPDEYMITGRLLIIWSFNTDSELKVRSKEKVRSIIN